MHDEKEMKALEEKFRKNAFTLDDYLTQMEQMKKMGGIGEILKMIPGAASKGINIDEKELIKNKSIILSMTKEERLSPEILKASRKQRIAKGSGTTVADINKLLKQFEAGKEMMKKMKSGGMRGLRGMMG
jgi:signal recognition particle subunit SRP54